MKNAILKFSSKKTLGNKKKDFFNTSLDFLCVHLFLSLHFLFR